jgi:DNA-directed RNA polymerase subunit RPC12/RpoP
MPKCPKCGKEIDYLLEYTIDEYMLSLHGYIPQYEYIRTMEEEGMYEFLYKCPKCGETLFAEYKCPECGKTLFIIDEEAIEFLEKSNSQKANETESDKNVFGCLYELVG